MIETFSTKHGTVTVRWGYFVSYWLTATLVWSSSDYVTSLGVLESISVSAEERNRPLYNYFKSSGRQSGTVEETRCQVQPCEDGGRTGGVRVVDRPTTEDGPFQTWSDL